MITNPNQAQKTAMKELNTDSTAELDSAIEELQTEIDTSSASLDIQYQHMLKTEKELRVLRNQRRDTRIGQLAKLVDNEGGIVIYPDEPGAREFGTLKRIVDGMAIVEIGVSVDEIRTRAEDYEEMPF